ncbi:TonB-dependent receptor domain-containing protein [Litorimonas sp. RW-G-Af-16]|uniref:TonB-dependent receptor domain-containing protein n=1 Tax=Litorimonas sp. RW-G-Af-16 TaxID=3241168 RepID=UPI003AAF89AB
MPGNEETSTFNELEFTSTGAITRFVTDNTLEVQGDDFKQDETYLGGGLRASYDVSDRLTVTADASYSETERTEQGYQFRVQSNTTPVIAWDLDSGIPQYELVNDTFDVNDYGNYVDRLRIRIDNDFKRKNTSKALRLDAEYEVDAGIFTTLETGVRFSSLEYLALVGGNRGDGTRTEVEIRDNNDGRLYVNSGSETRSARGADGLLDIIGSTTSEAAGCHTAFPETNFLSSVREGDLITNIDSDGNVISSTNTWATFNATCIVNTGLDAINALGLVDPISAGLPSLLEENSSTIDVTENVTALYAMTSYETEFDGLPVRGNIGLRVLQTDVESIGYRDEYVVNGSDATGFTIDTTGETERIVSNFDYTTWLPSANMIVDLNDELLLRAGVFRALSRPDPADMGFDRELDILGLDDDETAVSRADLITGVDATGNPSFTPLTSWNYDIGVEWYPNPDSILAISTYLKQFKGGFENVIQEETYLIDGVAQTFNVVVPQASEETSNLFGVELTGSHRFSYLPGLLSGFGVKGSYNYAESDFEFEDSLYGDVFQRQLNGEVVQLNQGIVAPANIPGLSKHVFSGQVYYQIGDLDLQGIYKYRSDYFQPFIANGNRIRYVGDVGVFEARASYKINDNFRVSVEAINLFDEPKRQYKWTQDDVYEVNAYGPRIFFGLRGKF